MVIERMTGKQKLDYLEGRKARLKSRKTDNSKLIHKIDREIRLLNIQIK